MSVVRFQGTTRRSMSTTRPKAISTSIEETKIEAKRNGVLNW